MAKKVAAPKVDEELEMMKRVAEELNTKLGLDPKIDVEAEKEALHTELETNAREIVAADKKMLSEETWKYLEGEGLLKHLVKVSPQPAEKPAKAAKAAAPKKAEKPAKAAKEEKPKKSAEEIKAARVEALKKAREARKATAGERPSKKVKEPKVKGPSRHQVLFDSMKDKKKHLFTDLVKNMTEKFGGTEREAAYQIDNHMKLLIVMGVVEKSGEAEKLTYKLL